MANFPEMKTRQRLLKRFIEISAQGDSGTIEIRIAFKRHTYGTTPTGGRTVTATTNLSPQTFALMPFKRRQTDEAILTAPSSGRDEVTSVQHILISPLDNDVEKGDTFEWVGNEHLRDGTYEVEYVAARRHDRKLVGIYYSGPRS